jgi:hypothetical protein
MYVEQQPFAALLADQARFASIATIYYSDFSCVQSISISVVVTISTVGVTAVRICSSTAVARAYNCVALLYTANYQS